MHLKNKQNTAGFTIVELLIVIVIIAILAAITIVAYNGISRSAQNSSVQTEVKQVGSKILAYYAETGTFPEDLEQAGVSTSELDTVQVVYAPHATGFCLTGNFISNSNVVYNFDQGGAVQEGACTSLPPPPTIASCFDFNSSTRTITAYYTHESNNSSNPACPRGVVIPENINNIPVEAIGNTAFYSAMITSVIIPNSVTSIGIAAFRDNEITSLVLPNSIPTIGPAAFYNNKLTSLVIPDSVTSIEFNAFYDNELTSLVIPDSVTSIGSAAFRGNSLTSVTLPNSLTSIPSQLFHSNNLTSINIPSSVTSIGDSAFFTNKLTSATIPSSVQSIGASAFWGNPLGTISLPTATTVGSNAFSSSVTITRY